MAIFRILSTLIRQDGVRRYATNNKWREIVWIERGERIKELKNYIEEFKKRSQLELQFKSLSYKLGLSDSKLLRLRDKYNLSGALEISLERYQIAKHFSFTAQSKLLHRMVEDPAFDKCSKAASIRYQIAEKDIKSCTQDLYRELVNRAHGNREEALWGGLLLKDTEHTLEEVATIEAVFCTLKKLGHFYIPLKVVFQDEEHDLESIE